MANNPHLLFLKCIWFLVINFLDLKHIQCLIIHILDLKCEWAVIICALDLKYGWLLMICILDLKCVCFLIVCILNLKWEWLIMICVLEFKYRWLMMIHVLNLKLDRLWWFVSNSWNADGQLSTTFNEMLMVNLDLVFCLDNIDNWYQSMFSLEEMWIIVTDPYLDIFVLFLPTHSLQRSFSKIF